MQGSNSTHTCYMCPWCIKQEKLAGRWDTSQPRPQSMLAAKDLPTTQLSDHIELRVRLPEWLLMARNRAPFTAQSMTSKPVGDACIMLSCQVCSTLCLC
jgi:hypothetical protein